MAVPSKGQRMMVPLSLQCTSLQLALIVSRQDERQEGTRNWLGKMIPNPSSPAAVHSFSVGLSSPGPPGPGASSAETTEPSGNFSHRAQSTGTKGQPVTCLPECPPHTAGFSTHHTNKHIGG